MMDTMFHFSITVVYWICVWLITIGIAVAPACVVSLPFLFNLNLERGNWFFIFWVSAALIVSGLMIPIAYMVHQDLTEAWAASEPPFVSRAPSSAPVIILKTELRRYKLLEMRPPKQFYVDVKDVKTGAIYNHMYVSKHCNDYQRNKIGDEYNIEVVYKQRGEETWIEFQNLYGVFC